MIAILVGMIAVVNFVHLKIILPAVLIEARIQTREMIQNHIQNPHPGAVSREEFKMIVDEIRSLKLECNKRLDKIHEKLTQ